MDPTTLARAHRRDMAALNALAKRDISVAFSRVTNPDARVVRDTLELVLPELAQTYGSASATLAADWYDEVRRDQSIGGRFRAIASKLPDKGRTDALAGWAVNPLFSSAPDREATLSKLTGGFQKLVSDAGRDTIRDSALADPAARGWQRVGAGGCDFCRMLIGRGAVYSEETADFASHDHCRCSAYPILGDMGTIDIMEPAALLDSPELQSAFDQAEKIRTLLGQTDYGIGGLKLPGATSAEKTALLEYTSVYGRPTNFVLRDPANYSKWFDANSPGWDSTPQELLDRAKLIDKLFAKSTLSSDVSVARGVVATPAFDPATMKVGSFFADPAFYSTTTNLKEALAFSKGDAGLASRGITGQGWKIISEAPKGMPVLPGAGYQNELLFPRGTVQKVVRIDLKKRILYTRMVKP